MSRAAPGSFGILSGATRLGAARHEANSADAARCALALMCSAASVLECDHGRASGPACEEPSDADAAKGATSLLAWDAARAAIEVVLSAHEATRARAVVACLPTDDEDRAVLRERLRRPLRFLVAQACRRAALRACYRAVASSCPSGSCRCINLEGDLAMARDVVLDRLCDSRKRLWPCKASRRCPLQYGVLRRAPGAVWVESTGGPATPRAFLEKRRCRAIE